jgi:hypothetical protein
MHFIPSLKIAAAAALMALLVACGGGGGASGAPTRDVSFASAAIVVPANQSSISIALTSCMAELWASGTPVAISVTPTWVILPMAIWWFLPA